MPIDQESLKEANALIEEARSLQDTFAYTAEPVSKKAFVLTFLNRIPLYNSLLKRLNNAGLAISRLVNKSDSLPTVPLDAFKASPFIGIATSIIDFIQIPMLYTAAFILGEEPPISLSNNGKWLFASTTLALGLVAFFIPVTAPIIAIAIGSLELMASIITIGVLYHDYYEDKKALKLATEIILTGPSGQLEQCVIDLDLACQNPDTTAEVINKLTTEIIRLTSACEQQKDEIKKQYKEISVREEKLKIEVEVMDAGVRMVMSSLVVAGTVTSLFFPPVGLGILLAAALGGSIYVGGRLAAPHVPTFQSSPKDHKDNKNNATPHTAEEVKGSTPGLLSGLGVKPKAESPQLAEQSAPVVASPSTTEPPSSSLASEHDSSLSDEKDAKKPTFK